MLPRAVSLGVSPLSIFSWARNTPCVGGKINPYACCVRRFVVVEGKGKPKTSIPLIESLTAKVLGGRHLHSSRTVFAQKQEKDYYQILGVAKSATKAEIKKAYHNLAKKYHPDANPDKDAAERFKEASSAYEVLGDDSKRQMYDQHGHKAFDESQFHAAQNVNADDLLRHFGFDLGQMFGMEGFDSDTRTGADIEVPLRINFMEAVQGVEKELKFNSKVACSTCSGTGAKSGSQPSSCKTCQGRGNQVLNNGFFQYSAQCRTCHGEGRVISNPCTSCKGNGVKQESRTLKVAIPAGVDNGNHIRVVGQGGAGVRNGPSGNLFVKISVTEDQVFKRDGLDVHVEVPITVSQAILGGTVQVPTLTSEVEVTIPPGTQPSEKRVLKQKGIPKVNSSAKGNQYIHFKVVVPSNLTTKQKELMEEFQKGEELPKHSKSFFGKIKDFMNK